MPLNLNIVIDIFGIVLLIIILYKECNKTTVFRIDQNLFIGIIVVNMLVLLFDMFTYIFNDINNQVMYIFNHISSFLYFIFVPAPCYMWSLYADYKIMKNEKRIKKVSVILLIPGLINVIMCVIGLFTNVFYTIDINNHYERGSLFWISAILSYSYLVYTLIFTIKNRRKCEIEETIPLYSFIIIPFIVSLIQNTIPGISILWVSTTFSLLIVYINLQNTQLITDYLTGLYNRRELNNYALMKIKKKTDGKFIAGLMIDIDKFKAINDEYGHQIGDVALIDTANILKQSVKKGDFIARYGGDEFFIITEVKSKKDIELLIKKIQINVDEFNLNDDKQFFLSLSIGYSIYDIERNLSVEKFFDEIDEKMYIEKSIKKAE